ncbi:MAG: DUF4404 family protein [Planctomycetota bacterium]|nr:DUF4404 family protein [Planctomycetota bacterium]MDA1177897.1 DUF4404 family protein [Planctomycetota bacterium]
MDPAKFRETLSQIHNELEVAHSVDDESRKILIELLHDIERILTVDAPSAGAQDAGGVMGQLKKSVEHFEDSHPFLASLIGRIADGLSNMGI